MATRTTEPADLRALWVAFVAVFTRALLGGIRGDDAHGTEGYHIGGLYVDDDYSVSDRRRDRPMFRVDPNASGIDLTLPPDLMRLLTARLIAALRAGNPRVFFIREINGTLDGRTTVNYDVLLGRQNYRPDAGHLWHIHLGIFRIYALTAAQILGFIEVCAGLPAGALTPAGAGATPIVDTEPSEEDDMTPEQAALLANLATTVQDIAAAVTTLQDQGTFTVNRLKGTTPDGVWFEMQDGKAVIVPAPADGVVRDGGPRPVALLNQLDGNYLANELAAIKAKLGA